METTARPRVQTIEVAPPPDMPDPTQTQVVVRPRPFYAKFMFIIPAMLTVATILGASLVGRNYFNQVQPTPAPTPAATLIPASPRPTLRPIVKKKIYTNPTYEFTFKYPELYLIHECDSGFKLFSKTTQITTPTTNCNTEPFGVVNLRITDELTLPEFVDPDSVIKESIKVDYLEATTYTSDSSTHLSFEYQSKHFLFSLYSTSETKLFDDLVKSIRFTTDITTNWTEYAASEYSFAIKHPPSWTFTDKGEGAFELIKDLNEKTLFRAVIEAQNNLENANVTATQLISSTKNLTGWSQTPSVDIQNLGGGTAQILQGEYEGQWRRFIAVWYQNNLIQIILTDSLDQAEANTFNAILGSFKFIN